MEKRIKYLFRQYLANKCSRKEFEEFFSYIKEAASDGVLRELIKKVYDEAGVADRSFTHVDESGNLVLVEPSEFVEQAATRKPRSRKMVAAWVVMAIAVVAAVSFLLKKSPGNHAVVTTTLAVTKKVTERSEYKYLLLPDSTQVWLNAASSLEFPDQFTGDKREVILSGEAFFDVKHADKVPFIIHTGKISTWVLGTAFNIKAYPGRKNVVVSVSRGKVKVNYDDKEIATLVKGQQVKINNHDSNTFEKKTIINEPGEWQHGNMTYDDETFEDIIADMEHIYNVNIRIDNNLIGKQSISTSFKSEIGVEQELQVLCRLTDTELKKLNGVYIIK